MGLLMGHYIRVDIIDDIVNGGKFWMEVIDRID